MIEYFKSTIGCSPAGPLDDEAASRRCVSRDALQRSNFAGAFFLDDKLCIARDNYPTSKKYFAAPAVDVYADAALSAQLALGAPYFATGASSAQTGTYAPGEPLVTLTVGARAGIAGFLALPSGTLAGGLCDDRVPAGFLLNDASPRRCVRRSSSAIASTAECQAYFSAEGFAALSVLASAGAASAVPITIGSVTCYASDAADAAPVPCTGPTAASGLPDTLYDAGNDSCLNVARAIAYEVRYSASFQISAVVLTAEFVASVPSASAASSGLMQTFAVQFVQAVVTGEQRAKSGNPGYRAGAPVLGGVRASADATSVTPGDLTVPMGSGDGTCRTAANEPNAHGTIGFGRDAISGCSVELNLASFADCADLSARFQALLAPASNAVNMVAKWGASDPAVVDDWLALEDVPPSAAASGTNGLCTGVVTGVQYDFLVTPLGSLTNPQLRITGARRTYVTGSTRFRCMGVSCSQAVLNAGASTDVATLLAEVRFTSVPSEAPETVRPRNPNLLPELPSDVFYPFRIDYSPAGRSAVSAPLLGLLVLLVLAVLLS